MKGCGKHETGRYLFGKFGLMFAFLWWCRFGIRGTIVRRNHLWRFAFVWICRKVRVGWSLSDRGRERRKVNRRVEGMEESGWTLFKTSLAWRRRRNQNSLPKWISGIFSGRPGEKEVNDREKKKEVSELMVLWEIFLDDLFRRGWEVLRLSSDVSCFSSSCTLWFFLF